MRVGINGFGRIGRNFYRALRAGGDTTDVEVVAVNDITDNATLAHLLKYDSILGRLPDRVVASDDGLSVGSDTIRVLAQRDPAALSWADLGVDVVVESTGKFTNAEDARKHIDAGARTVVISAPAKGADLTILMGVNDDQYDPAAHTVVSTASCTTNCIGPLAKVLVENFGLVRGLLTTVHAYTNDQPAHDTPHKDLRRARAAAHNIIPTTTGAAQATALALPELSGKLSGIAMRVPVIDGSVTDLVADLERPVSTDEVNAAYRHAAEGPLKGYLHYTEDPIVSSDIVGSPASCTFDAGMTMTSENQVKVIGWYDNEWGFSQRLVDTVRLVGSRA